MDSDNKEFHQNTKINIELGILKQAFGSVKFEYGKTSVICSVYGPIEARPQEEKINQSNIEVQIKPGAGLTGTSDRWMEYSMQKAFENMIMLQKYPRMRYKFNVQIINDDGGIEAAVINAGFLALLDAGIPLKSKYFATTVFIDEQGKEIEKMPYSEIKNFSSFHTMAFDIENPVSPIYTNSRGKFSIQEIKKVQECSVNKCKKLSEFVFERLRDVYTG